MSVPVNPPCDEVPVGDHREAAPDVTVSLSTDGAVARLTLERPEALNALSRAVAAGLEESLGRLEQSQDVGNPWLLAAGAKLGRKRLGG